MSEVTIGKVIAVIEEAVNTWGSQRVIPEGGWSVETIAEAILKHCTRCKVDISMALAQGWVECHFGVNPSAVRSRKTRNIFNVGNVDSGANRGFASWEAGIAAYCELMAREYNYREEADGSVTLESMVRHDFTRPIGGRYASAPSYTAQVRALALKIRRKLV